MPATRRSLVLITDFGDQDWFVGTMKGVIKGIAPDVDVLDLTHQIPEYNIAAGSFALLSSYPYFPPGTVFCAVVDPGVGGERQPLVISAGDYFFTAPDNGLLAIPRLAQEKDFQARIASNPEFYRTRSPDATFHGRDVFAPLAAHLARGVSLEEMGPPADSLVPCAIPEPRSRNDHFLEGEIIYVDRFGNLILNISRTHVQGSVFTGLEPAAWRLEINHVLLHGLSRTFSDKKNKELLFYWGSSDFLEIAVNQGNAAATLNSGIGSAVHLSAIEKK